MQPAVTRIGSAGMSAICWSSPQPTLTGYGCRSWRLPVLDLTPLADRVGVHHARPEHHHEARPDRHRERREVEHARFRRLPGGGAPATPSFDEAHDGDTQREQQDDIGDPRRTESGSIETGDGCSELSEGQHRGRSGRCFCALPVHVDDARGHRAGTRRSRGGRRGCRRRSSATAGSQWCPPLLWSPTSHRTRPAPDAPARRPMPFRGRWRAVPSRWVGPPRRSAPRRVVRSER